MTPARLTSILLPAAVLAGCASAIPPPVAAPPPRPATQRTAPPPTRPAAPPPATFRAPVVQHIPGLENILQQPAAALVRQFGQPRLDVREGDMRKLQFTGTACVLDVFLYPLTPGAEPVATAIAARRPSDGQDVEQTACVAALLRR